MTDRWTDRLSAYLDDELGAEERAQLDAHLTECVPCRTTLAELSRVVERARALPAATEPTADLWPRILEHIETADVVPIGPARERSTKRFTFTLPQAIAAGLALLLAGGLTARFALGPGASDQPVALVEESPNVAPTGVTFARYQPPVELERRLVELESALNAARGRLDSETIAVIEKNLAIVEAAVEEAIQALNRDPANDYLRAHLDRTLRVKVDVLERATTLAGAET